MNDTGIPIGKAAVEVGVPRKTLRQWSEKRYVVPSGRTPGGHARYTAADVRRAIAFRSLRDGGLSVAKALASLRVLNVMASGASVEHSPISHKNPSNVP